MKLIPLGGKRGKGYFAMVDDDLYDYLCKYKWFVNVDGYVKCWVRISKGIRKQESMHRIVLAASGGQIVDHVNRKKFDNQRKNLRFCTSLQNSRNASPFKKLTSSSFKGVSWNKHARKFKVAIRTEKERILIGYFDSEYEAAHAYNRAALEFHGEFASINENIPIQKYDCVRGNLNANSRRNKKAKPTS